MFTEGIVLLSPQVPNDVFSGLLFSVMAINADEHKDSENLEEGRDPSTGKEVFSQENSAAPVELQRVRSCCHLEGGGSGVPIEQEKQLGTLIRPANRPVTLS